MTEHDVLRAVLSGRVVPVVVLDDLETAVPVASALAEGGLPVAEVTFRTAVAATRSGASPPRQTLSSEPAPSCGPSRSTRRSTPVRDSSSPRASACR